MALALFDFISSVFITWFEELVEGTCLCKKTSGEGNEDGQEGHGKQWGRSPQRRQKKTIRRELKL